MDMFIKTKIFNEKGQFITKRCLKAKRQVKVDSAMNDLFGEAPPSKYGVNNEQYLKNQVANFRSQDPKFYNQICILKP